MTESEISSERSSSSPYARVLRTPFRQPAPSRQTRLVPRWSIWGAILSLVVVACAAKISQPYRRASLLHARVRQLQRQVASFQAEQAQLRQQNRTLATDWGQLQEAHRQGYVFPGERRIIFLQPEQAPAPQAVGNRGANQKLKRPTS